MERRRTDRHQSGWTGLCAVSGPGLYDWRECSILDVSTLGAALELDGISYEDLEGATVAISVELRGEVRYVVHHEAGKARVGVEFVGVNVGEEGALRVVVHQDA